MAKNVSTKYYQENKEILKKAREIYQNISKEEEDKKQQYGCERYKSLSKDEKQKLLSIEEKTLYYNCRKMI